MTERLRRVEKYARLRRHAEKEYRRAVELACEEHTDTEVGRAAGVTKQAIGQMLKRNRGGKP